MPITGKFNIYNEVWDIILSHINEHVPVYIFTVFYSYFFLSKNSQMPAVLSILFIMSEVHKEATSSDESRFI